MATLTSPVFVKDRSAALYINFYFVVSFISFLLNYQFVGFCSQASFTEYFPAYMINLPKHDLVQNGLDTHHVVQRLDRLRGSKNPIKASASQQNGPWETASDVE